jgi:hypothetical protein
VVFYRQQKPLSKSRKRVFLKNFLWLLAAVRAFVFSLKREIYKTNQAASIAV